MKSATILMGILMIMGVSCHHEQLPEEIMHSVVTCMKELNISEDEKKEVMENHDFSNPKLHCLSECMQRVSGMLIGKEVNSEQTKKILHNMHSDMSDEEIEATIQKCLGEAQAKEDKCEFAMSYQNCMKNSLGME